MSYRHFLPLVGLVLASVAVGLVEPMPAICVVIALVVALV